MAGSENLAAGTASGEVWIGIPWSYFALLAAKALVNDGSRNFVTS